eukprot:jgi/Astpho2/7384/fgenesh1_pg.00114_%23_29_t
MSGGHTVAGPQARLLQGIVRYGKGALIATGTLSLLGTAVAVSNSKKRSQKAIKLPDSFVLELDLEDVQVVEQQPSPFAFLASGGSPAPLHLPQVVHALKEAGKDGRVRGLVGVLGGQPAGQMAQIQELRDAVLRFRRDARVPTLAFAETFGELSSNGTASYYLGTAFEQMWMQKSGLLGFTGFAANSIFLRGLLDKWKVRSFFTTRESYKNQIAMYRDKGYNQSNRENWTALLQGWTDQVVSGVAEARGLSQQKVRAALDAAPFTGEEAVKLGLLDGLLYRTEAISTLRGLPVQDTVAPKGAAAAGLEGAGQLLPVREGKTRVVQPDGTEAQLQRVPVRNYIRHLEKLESKKLPMSERWQFLRGDAESSDHLPDTDSSVRSMQPGKPAVAVITASGEIFGGKLHGSLYVRNVRWPGKAPPSTHSPRSDAILSTPLCEVLREAGADRRVRAVVLRVDSPGGSSIAADAIYREVQRLQEAGKPVVVSMGNVAVSGGYYISAPANKIVAQPGTLTGSIGVLNGKLNYGPALADQGVSHDSVEVGANSNAGSPFADFTKAQIAILERTVDDVYIDFMDKVGKGRNMSLAEVRKVAQGRIWTGDAALKHGLVDELGGLQTALRLAKQEAGLPLEDDAVQIKALPKPQNAVEAVLKMMRTGQQAGAGVSANGGFQQALQLAAQHGLLRLEPGQMLACQVPTQVAQWSGIQMMVQMPHLS